MFTPSGIFSAVGLAFCVAVGAASAEGPGLGKPLTEAEVAAWDISIQPDGKGLPSGAGAPAQGAASMRKSAPNATVRRAKLGSRA